MIKINMIWATDPNGYIGYKNQLLFESKKDLKTFQELTTGKGNNAVVMGRRTFESIGSKPLKNRLNIVLSKNESFEPENVITSRSIQNVIKVCEEHNIEELWVIGGKEIYEQFLELSTTCVVTYFDQHTDKEPEECIQFLPDLSQFYKLLYTSNVDVSSDNLPVSYTTMVHIRFN